MTSGPITVVKGRLLGGKLKVEVSIRGKKIHKIRELRQPATAKDLVITPGLVDVQVNGYMGYGFSGGKATVEEVAKVCRAMALQGTTHFVPTIITCPDKRRIAGCKVIAEACDQGADKGSILGIHLEGPYLSPKDGPCGAHHKGWMKDPSWREVQEANEASGGRVIYLTIAPERKGAVPFIKKAVKAGMVVALGHTCASTDQIKAAVDAGAKFCTHLGNGSHPVVPRLRNYIWDQLGNDKLYASFIPDGFHLPDSALRCFYRAKQFEKTILVSDVASMGGMKPGIYGASGSPDKFRLNKNGLITVVGRESLAGAASLLDHGIGNFVRVTGVSLQEALTLATLHPAKLFGRHGARAGRLRVGGPAFLAAFEWDAKKFKLKAKRVFRRGEEEDLSKKEKPRVIKKGDDFSPI